MPRARNPDVRRDWTLNENISIAKTFGRRRASSFDVRIEAFNLFNRVDLGCAEHELQQQRVRADHVDGDDPRQMQIGLKMYW